MLVEYLTLWLSNLLMTEDANALEHERATLLEVLPVLPGKLILKPAWA